MTEVQLKEYFEAQLHSQRELFEAKLHAMAVASDKAEKALSEWKHGANEIREAMRDQSEQMATRRDLEAHSGAADARLKALEISRAQVELKLYGLTILISAIVSAAVRYLIQ